MQGAARLISKRLRLLPKNPISCFSQLGALIGGLIGFPASLTVNNEYPQILNQEWPVAGAERCRHH
jgi:hypothetical protein